MLIWEQKRGHPKTRIVPKKREKDTMSTQSSAHGSLNPPEAQQVIKAQELRFIIEANVPCQGVGDVSETEDVTCPQRSADPISPG